MLVAFVGCLLLSSVNCCVFVRKSILKGDRMNLVDYLNFALTWAVNLEVLLAGSGWTVQNICVLF